MGAAALAFVLVFAYSLYDTPPLDYTELEVTITTHSELFSVGEVVAANVTLFNPGPEAVYVKSFPRALVSYMEHEFPPIVSAIVGKRHIKIPGDSEYLVISGEFALEKPGLMVIDFYGFNKTVGVWDLPDEALWGRPAEIIQGLQSDIKNPSVDFSSWFAVASKLGSLNRTGKLSYLPYILVEYYPDWINGTAYIAMTDISHEYTQPILDQFSPHIQDDIRFIKAPAPRVVVERWMGRVWGMHDELEEAGVMIWESSYYFDGRMLLGVEDLDQEKADTLCRIVDDVPPGIYVLVDSEPIEEF